MEGVIVKINRGQYKPIIVKLDNEPFAKHFDQSELLVISRPKEKELPTQ